MKKIKILIIALCFFSLNVAYSQTYIRINHNPQMDSLLSNYNSYCSRAVPVPYMLSGIAKGYNMLTDSVTLQFFFGDGIDTTFKTNIYSDSLYSFNVYGMHHYSLTGIYNMKLFVIAPDLKKDSVVKFNFLIGNSCKTITGTIYNDLNINCDNSGEPNFSLPYSLCVLFNNQLISRSVFSSPYFSIQIPDGFNYDLVMQNNNNGIFCPTSIHVASLPSTNNNFGFQCNPGFNLAGMSTVFGFNGISDNGISSCIMNYGCSPVTGKLKIIFDNTRLIASYCSFPYTVSGDTVITSFTNLQPLSSFNPVNLFHLTTNAHIGDTVYFTFLETPCNGDNDTTNNVQKFFVILRGSYDPNEKSVYPQGDGPDGLIDNNINMMYTVHFQNTGNAPAQNIYIIDTLDSDLDIGTFSVIESSHYMTYTSIGNRVIKFSFPNINLLDSGTNQEASNGYLTYAIRQNPNLTPGTKILNTAYIYFDYNPAIVTNTVLNTIITPTSINEPEILDNVMIYPNPSDGIINVVLESVYENGSIVIMNLCGQIIFTTHFKNKKQTLLDLSKLPKGMYLIKIKTDISVLTRKVIIE